MIYRNLPLVFAANPSQFSVIFTPWHPEITISLPKRQVERKAKQIISIFISCLGLVGLSAYMTVIRTKEIGIRKVLGAKSVNIFYILSKEFVIWILISTVFAFPIGWYFMNKWLQEFAYRTDLSIWIFLLSGLAAFCIALLTVSYQSIKAASANPVDSLRYE
ncbi:MAG: FtsX-like permease family protein [Candidatus Aminicenantes bacterium]|nr:MAG: FtsX-like permease family protein [Candidatus Aminicenantes bacterium]